MGRGSGARVVQGGLVEPPPIAAPSHNRAAWLSGPRVGHLLRAIRQAAGKVTKGRPNRRGRCPGPCDGFPGKYKSGLWWPRFGEQTMPEKQFRKGDRVR